MEAYDDDLIMFDASGAKPLPAPEDRGFVENDHARIWYATFGSGAPVILLHGGPGNSGNWGYQVPDLLQRGYRAILIDSRDHGRSTRDSRSFSYERMATDVLAVMDVLHIKKAGLVGWSDGAVIALMVAGLAPARVAGVFFFGCNMDPSGAKQITEANPVIERCLARHKKDYSRLSSTPDQFDAFFKAVGLMQRSEPNYTATDLARISVPVTIVQSEHDEFIKREHAEYLAQNIPNGEFVLLPGVSHFAPLQQPALFNAVLLEFLTRILP